MSCSVPCLQNVLEARAVCSFPLYLPGLPPPSWGLEKPGQGGQSCCWDEAVWCCWWDSELAGASTWMAQSGAFLVPSGRILWHRCSPISPCKPAHGCWSGRPAVPHHFLSYSAFPLVGFQICWEAIFLISMSHNWKPVFVMFSPHNSTFPDSRKKHLRVGKRLLGRGRTGGPFPGVRSLSCRAWSSDGGQHMQGCLSFCLPKLSKGRQTTAQNRKARW